MANKNTVRMPKKQAKVGKVMHEYKVGNLKSGTSAAVTDPDQAIAIALSEAGLSKRKRKRGKK